LHPFLFTQLRRHLDDVALCLLSLDFGSGFSVDSVCHLADCPGLAIQRTFGELFSNAPQFADALRIVLVNRLCEHNSQLISKLLFARQAAERVAGLAFFPRHCFAILSPINAQIFRSGTQNYVLHSRTNQESQAKCPGSGEWSAVRVASWDAHGDNRHATWDVGNKRHPPPRLLKPHRPVGTRGGRRSASDPGPYRAAAGAAAVYAGVALRAFGKQNAAIGVVVFHLLSPSWKWRRVRHLAASLQRLWHYGATRGG